MSVDTGHGPEAFSTDIAIDGGEMAGPWRMPRQMLAEQSYGDHASIHDDATAQKLGFKGGTIEGPTHFSQFAPLGYRAWGSAWFEKGCVSAHYRTVVYEGEKVRARMTVPAAGSTSATIRMEKEDGSEVLRGTASIGPGHAATALDQRLAELAPLVDPVVIEGVKIGMRTARQPIRMGADQIMGRLYPFTLNQKLERITEPSDWYAAPARSSPFGRAIIPMEMISVLLNHAAGDHAFYTRGPVIGLFADQEIRLLDGPLFVGEPYEMDREVVATSGSRRTESLWVLSRVYRPGTEGVIATMLLNSAILKDSYPDYEAERRRLYPA